MVTGLSFPGNSLSEVPMSQVTQVVSSWQLKLTDALCLYLPYQEKPMLHESAHPQSLVLCMGSIMNLCNLGHVLFYYTLFSSRSPHPKEVHDFLFADRCPDVADSWYWSCSWVCHCQFSDFILYYSGLPVDDNSIIHHVALVERNILLASLAECFFLIPPSVVSVTILPQRVTPVPGLLKEVCLYYNPSCFAPRSNVPCHDLRSTWSLAVT